MNHGRTIFSQLMDGLPKYEFDQCVRRCRGNYRVRSLPAYEQFLVMAVAQLTYRESLRDIQTCLGAVGRISCTARLKPLMPKTQILILTVSADSETIFRALEAGADGYLLKRSSPEELQTAVLDALKGGVPMTSEIARRVIASLRRKPAVRNDAAYKPTPREEEILTLLSKGYVSKEIASQLGVSYETVRDHLKRIYEKLHVHSRGEAVARFQETLESAEE